MSVLKAPPRRPDRRRDAPNAMKAQRRRRARPPHRGEAERIAARRLRAFELRKSGRTFREIAHELGVDLHTAHADVESELMELRTATVAEVESLRQIELERIDTATHGVWRALEKGDPRAVGAFVRLSERRARLLGLDAPIATTSKATVEFKPDEERAKQRAFAIGPERSLELITELDAVIAKVRGELGE